MPELVIVIADLYLGAGADEATAHPLPGLEYIGRFGEAEVLTAGWRAWLARRGGRSELAELAPASIAAAVLERPPSAAACYLASAIHLSPGPAGVHLARPGLLRLNAGESSALAVAFAADFAGTGLLLTPLAHGALLLEAAALPEADTTEPARCIGRDLIQALPGGTGGPALRRVQAEIEMWLHGLPFNEARARRGALPVTTLWLWGGGAARAPARQAMPRLPLAYGCDPYLDGLWHLLGGTSRLLPQRLAPDGAAAVWVLEVGAELQHDEQASLEVALARLDTAFLSPAVLALRRGAVSGLTLIANDRCLHLGRRSGLRRWRRSVHGLGSLA